MATRSKTTFKNDRDIDRLEPFVGQLGEGLFTPPATKLTAQEVPAENVQSPPNPLTPIGVLGVRIARWIRSAVAATDNEDTV